MLPAGSGTLPHRPWTPMSLVNGRSPQAKRCGRDGAKRKSVRKRLPLRGSRCVGDSPRKPLRHHREATASREGARHIEKQLPPGTAHGSIGKQLHSAKQGAIATRNLPNQLHREATPQRKARHLRESILPQSSIGNQLHSAKHSTIGRSNLLNQQHREEHFLSNNGAKRAGAEVVRGSNLACFLKNFVSNYIVIFLMMLFRVHL